MSSWPGELLEGYPHAELYTPRARGIGAVLGASRRELQEVDRREAGNRRAPVSVVEDVDRLDAKLRPNSLSHPELLEKREVEVPDRRPAEKVAARVAEPLLTGAGRLREQALVVVSFSARSNLADRLRFAIEVDSDGSAALAVQISVRAVNVERRAGERGKYAVELPIAQKPAKSVVGRFQEGQFINKAHLEDMRPVEARHRVVCIIHQRVIPGEPDPSVLVGHVPCATEGVGALQHESLPERPVQCYLQRVVPGPGA